MRKLIDQYKELCADSRHYDTNMWLVPSAAFTMALFSYNVIFDDTDYGTRMIVSAISGTIMFAFIIMFAKMRLYQLHIQRSLNTLGEKCFGEDFFQANTYALLDVCDDPNDRWYVKMSQKTVATTVMIWAMILVLLVDVGIFVWSISGYLVENQQTTILGGVHFS